MRKNTGQLLFHRELRMKFQELGMHSFKVKDVVWTDRLAESTDMPPQLFQSWGHNVNHEKVFDNIATEPI